MTAMLFNQSQRLGTTFRMGTSFTSLSQDDDGVAVRALRERRGHPVGDDADPRQALLGAVDHEPQIARRDRPRRAPAGEVGRDLYISRLEGDVHVLVLRRFRLH